MLGIGKLRPGRADYYLEAVAAGAEDYYLSAGEAPGVWVGRHAATLGLSGTVAPDDLRAILNGLDPTSGGRLDRARANRLAGFDLTFSAPKSVSILFALADPAISAAVKDGHDAAVTAVLGWLEDQACVVRRGRGGAIERPGDGFVMAAFAHRTSRAGDPHLHTHVLVANLTRGPDGRWSAPDGRHLFAWAKTAGHLYEAVLRHELTCRLGLSWGPVRNGVADLEGIPRSLIESLSVRRAQILERLDELGLHSARAAQVAALDTRHAKDPDLDIEELRLDWADIAADHDITPDTLTRLFDATTPTTPDTAEQEKIVTGLLGERGLTEHTSTFDRRHVIQAWCNQLPTGAQLDNIEGLTDHTLTHPSVIAVGENAGAGLRRDDGRRIGPPDLGSRYSTRELLALEQRLVTRAETRAHERSAVVPPAALQAAFARHPGLSDEQQAMVARLTRAGRGVEVVVAAAGTGKTYALDAAHHAWATAGYRVIGCALAARAAHHLQTATGIDSTTIAVLTRQLRDGYRLDPNTVVVVDEAAMVGTRVLAPILDAAHHARAKVVLAGDPRQLPEIEAGGLLHGLDQRLGAIRLLTNRRQTQPWERDALHHLRAGRTRRALAAYLDHERVTTAPTAAALRAALTADYLDSQRRGESSIMLAGRRADVTDLNRRARVALQAAGRLHGPALHVAGHDYQTGDRIITLRNVRRLGLLNGTTATITALDPQRRTLTVQTDDGTTRTVPADYLDAGHVSHGYATTIHKAQGLTVDRAFILADDTLSREAAYTALSRGRLENRIYTLAAEPEHDHGHLDAPDALDELTRNLERVTAQQLALDHHTPPATPPPEADLGLDLGIDLL